MSPKILALRLVGLVLLVFSMAGCLKYNVVDDCKLHAEFKVTNDVISCPDLTCPVLFIDSSVQFTGQEYEWNFADGGSSAEASPPHSFAPRPEPYPVKLTVRLGEGCFDAVTHNIWVLDGGPVAKFITDKANNTCLTNELITFTSESKNYDSLEWDFGDGNHDVSATVQHSYAIADDYTVQLTAIRGTQRHTYPLIIKVNAIKFEHSDPNNLGPAKKIKQLQDRHYVIIGNSIVSGKNKPYIYFADENGGAVNTIPITSVGDDAIVNDFTVLPNGDFALVGTTNRKVGNVNTKDIFYLWLDSAGNPKNTVGLPASTKTDALNESASSVITTANGGIMIVGRVEDPLNHTSDIYIYKAQANLDNIDINKIESLPNYEEGIAAAEVSGGAFVIIGQTRANAFSSTPDILSMKINAFGTIIGSPHSIGNAASGEEAVSLAKAADGLSLMICGRATTNGNEDFYLVKTDLNGDVIGNPLTVADPLGIEQISNEINPTKDGGYLVSGIQGANPYFFTIDANGNTNLFKPFPKNGTEGFNSGVQTSDGGFVFAGYLENSKLYLVKTDKNGNAN